MEYLSCLTDIKIPESVAVCPDCGKQLTISQNGWTQGDDGEWLCTSFDTVCGDEPDVEEDSEAFAEWEEQHTRSYEMPYVYWLPVDIKIEKWLEKNYRFTGL